MVILRLSSKIAGRGGVQMQKKMTAKRTPPLPLLRLRYGGLKLLIVVSILLCVFGLWKLQSQSEILPSKSTRGSGRVDISFEGTPKIAFLFLARRHLPLDFLWGTFFEVAWGESSMIQAERLLLDAALEDPANQRFVLLCVPLYNFSYIYNYIVESPTSFVDSFLDKKEGRFNPPMSPVIPKDKWRKGSQQPNGSGRREESGGENGAPWFTLIRRHAEVVVDDELVFPIFKKFCKRRPPIDGRKGKLNLKLQKQHNCIPDEHYVQTFLAMMGLEDQLERRTLTYTLWNESASKMEGKGWHPVTFSYSTAGPQWIKEIKDINHVYYETEYRTEWCRTNATSVPCFLFARKFSEGAAMRLLSEGYDPSPLLDKNT
ncbi:hypothetical protein Cgig2_011258 [Carnegiea gigantea]|uniref:Uncharacterized protein n=1 Tax=Carnegiea gigantea TaxID=171969 RepID=A0A9Q1QJC6_9CARY|nr:hypothetical protein Cgig2_011258 [Carnegiea gigantea]